MEKWGVGGDGLLSEFKTGFLNIILDQVILCSRDVLHIIRSLAALLAPTHQIDVSSTPKVVTNTHDSRNCQVYRGGGVCRGVCVCVRGRAESPDTHRLQVCRLSKTP